MISTDFAPNESWSDAWLSLKLLFQPWRWYTGKESDEVKRRILSEFSIFNSQLSISTFLTGRAALYHLLKSFKLPSGSEIAVQAFTCEAVVLPVMALKLKPVYVDIETQTFSMDPIDLEKKLSDSTKAVILQHTFGMTPVQREKILSIIKKKKLLLIEDIAHRSEMSKLITKMPNHYFLLSFGRSKAISSVFGGAIVSSSNLSMKQCNNVTISFITKLLLYKPLIMLIRSTYDIGLGKILHRLFNLTGLLSQEITKKEKGGDYDPLLDKTYPNVLSILLLYQLKNIVHINESRAQICFFYQKNLKIENCEVKKQPLIRFPLLVKNRGKALETAAACNIFLGKWYDQVVAPNSLDLSRVGYKPGSCPTAEKACKQIINLPTNISLTDAKKVAKVLREVETLNDVTSMF